MPDKVICVGFCCVDVCIRGVAQIDFSKELIPVKETSIWIGGDAVNESYVLNKLGKKVELITGLGGDPTADFIRMVLDEAGVDYSKSVTNPDSPSMLSVPLIREDAERSFFNAARPESLSFRVDPEKIRGARVVSLASLYFPPFDDVDNALAVARTAKESGAIVCADMMYSEGCRLETYRDLWPCIDYFFPNQEEARGLTGEDDPDRMAERILSFGVSNVIIKIGKRGCLARNRDTRMIVPPFLVEAVDTTGAGDNFAAGFITGLMEGQDLYHCCRYANAAASIAVAHIGASTGVRSREQLQEVLDSEKEVSHAL